MVGFPGETEDDFKELMEFTRWARFERMGAFAYSEEDGTYSCAHFKDDVPEVKNGYECGIAVKNYNDVRPGDQIEVYEIVEIQRTL